MESVPPPERETAITRRRPPASSADRRARRTSVGPILPLAPITITSPSSRRMNSRSASLGRDNSSSSSSTVFMSPQLRAGDRKFALRRSGARVLPAAHPQKRALHCETACLQPAYPFQRRLRDIYRNRTALKPGETAPEDISRKLSDNRAHLRIEVAGTSETVGRTIV